MSEASQPTLSNYDRRWSKLLEPKAEPKPRFRDRFKPDVDPDDVKKLAAVVSVALLLTAGSEAKTATTSLHNQLTHDRAQCYEHRPTTEFAEECTDPVLFAGEIVMGAFTVIGFAGGMLVAGRVLASEIRREE